MFVSFNDDGLSLMFVLCLIQPNVSYIMASRHRNSKRQKSAERQ